jgi:hypothetical protein
MLPGNFFIWLFAAPIFSPTKLNFMTPETFFTLINIAAAVGWILILVISRFWKGADAFLVCVVFAILAVAYSWFNFAHIVKRAALPALNF